MVNGLEEVSSVIQSNHAEVSRRLDELYDNLVGLRVIMKDASDQETSRVFQEMSREVSDTTRHCLLRKQVESVLQSLKFDKISERKSNIPKAHQDTFRWALSDSTTTLPSWLRCGSGVYWIEGKAGCGKSTLMKFLQQEPLTVAMLNEWANGRPLLFVSHYFWAPGTELQRSLVGLFRTLLFQIFIKDPELMDLVCPGRMSQHGYAHLESWTVEELKVCFDRLSSQESLPSKLCFFIDGLDEFDGDHDELIDMVHSISRSKNVKICVASRPWIPFQRAFGGSALKLCVHELTRDDISQYAHDCLGQNEQYQQLQTRSADQAASLVSEITAASDGVFLWVYLVVRDLLGGLTNLDDMTTLKKRLQDMPRGLDSYFKRMLYSIDPVYLAEVSSLLRILAHTRVPLNTLLTWAHRQVPSTRLLAPNDSLAFRVHAYSADMKVEAREFNNPTLGSSFNPKEDDYDARTEKLRIVARCKDLVHVSTETQVADGDMCTYQVGFLHRTVADFVGLSSTKHIIGDHFDSKSQALLPTVALAETYLKLLSYSHNLFTMKGRFSWTAASNQYFLWVLYLACQTKPHSSSACLHIMYKLCTVLTNSHFTFNFNISLGDFVNGVEEVKYEKQNLLALVGTVMLADVSVNECCRRGEPLFASSGQLENMFWALQCRGCQAIYDWQVLQMLLIRCFRAQTVPELKNDGTVGLEWHKEVNLSIVEALTKLIRRTYPSLMPSIWCMCVMLMAFQSDQADREVLPSNLYDICLILIRHGAPRIVNFTATEIYATVAATWETRFQQWYPQDSITSFDTLKVLSRVGSIQKRDPTGSRLEKEFTNAKLSVDSK